MTTRKFPTPEEMRSKREDAAEADINAALDTVEKALLAGAKAVTWRWVEEAKLPVERALRDAGWRVQFTNDRGESLLVVEPNGPGPMAEFYDARQGR